MSTKIYDAYEWKGSVTEAFTFLNDMRSRVEKQAVRTLLTYQYHNQMPQFRLIEKIQETIKSGHSGPLNITSSAVIYLYKDRTFIQFFGLDRTWDRRLSKVKKLRDFHWQNQTDQPSNVTDSQWDERSKVWEGIMNKNRWCPSDAGLSFNFVSDSYPSLDNIVSKVYTSLKPVVEQH